MVGLDESELFLLNYLKFRESEEVRSIIDILRDNQVSIKELTVKRFKVYDNNTRGRVSYLLTHLRRNHFIISKRAKTEMILKLSDFFYFIEKFVMDFKIQFEITKKALGGI